MSDSSIKIRKATESDIPFLFNSWLKSYRSSNYAASIDNTIYYSEHHKVIERIFRYYDVLIACDLNDDNHIYGFACAGHTENIFTIHYVYVKHTFRRMKIATKLLAAFNHDSSVASLYTHQTKTASALAPLFNMIYHPYIAFDPAAYNGDKPEKFIIPNQTKEL